MSKFRKGFDFRTRRFFLIVIIVLMPTVYGCGKKIPEVSKPGDAALTAPAPYDIGEPEYDGVIRKSIYLTMRDGIKIAIDLYLPEGLPDDTKIPAILHQTRYWRSAELRWPFSIFFDKPKKIIRDFVTRGYAWIAVDARGSGASYGRRPCSWYVDETKDGAEIVDWIIAQPWSNGKVGSTGVSYAGTTVDFLVVNRHPAVKAAIPRFSLYDAYTDIAFPGGIHQVWFTEGWHLYNSTLDCNVIPDRLKERLGFLGSLAVKGVRPVDADEDGSLLAGAIRDHETNWNVHQSALSITFKDDPVKDPVLKKNLTVEMLSPYLYKYEMDRSGTAIYSYSGWFDGGYNHAAIKRFLTLTNYRNKLIIGPWMHGGQFSSDPSNGGRTRFDHTAEMMKFFNYYLKGKDTGIVKEKRVHYFTMVEGKWKGADTWPPECRRRRYYLGENNTLTMAPSTDGVDTYKADYTHGTGDESRWNTLLTGCFVQYPDRAVQDKKLLLYDSSPLKENTEVTGHPVLTVYVSSTADDGTFFAYLEDVAPDGTVHYVTEGMFRALHRNLSLGKPPYRHLVPYHSYKQLDEKKLVPGKKTQLIFDLLPTSYLFRKGHRIRVAFACADSDHFARIPAEAPTVEVYRGRGSVSHILLPVITE